jgi:hypothetical protein
VFIGEGSEFKIKSSSKPIFTVAQKRVEFAAATNIFMQDMDVEEMMLGMFKEGTEITYKRQNFDVKDVLTKNGWQRMYGPPDDKLGIIPVSEAHRLMMAEQNELSSNGTTKKREEERYRMNIALKEGDANKDVIESILKSYNDDDETHVHCFLRDDLKKLKEQEILL